MNRPMEEPQTPRKPPGLSSAILNDKVRRLRDELGLDIAPRDVDYSPARQKGTLGNALFARIQFLYFKNEARLDRAIEEFRQGLGESSPESRTQLLYDQLYDHTWFLKERIQTAPRPTRSTTWTASTTPSSSQQPQIARIDSGASHNDTRSDSMPPSPSSRKSKGGIEIKAGNYAQQQMQEASSNYGSSWDDHGLEVEQPMRASKLDFSKALNNPNGTETPRTRAAKRRRLENYRTEHLTDVAEELQATPAGERRIPGCHWQIRELVNDGFGTRYKHGIDAQAPFACSFERARLIRDAGLDENLANSVTSHQEVEDVLKSQGINFNQSSPSIWSSLSQTGGDDFTRSYGPLTGTISLNPKSDINSLFQLKLDPIVEGKSSRLERHFGSDRFLKVTLPSFEKQLPVHIQSDALQSALQDWLHTPKRLLGRTWRVYYGEVLKSKSSGKRASRVNNDHLKHRDLYFFATDGVGITPVLRVDMLNWQIPIKENGGQPAIKAFARLPLSNKKTTPTVCFKPDQIATAPDILANAEPEDTTFEDPAFQGKPRKSWATNEVMTDGCATISVGAALMIRETAGIVDFPSAFQGRINGHKGMWHVSASYETSNPKDLEVWIDLRPSQQKLIPRGDDLDERCKADRWCFELVSWSKPVSHASIHKDFLPVLRDRGVSRGALYAVISDAINIPIGDIREAMQDVGKFTIWSHETSGRDYEDLPNTRHGGLPVDSFSKCQLLINKTGYTPSTNHIVAKSAVQMAGMELERQRAHLSFPCIQSTSVYAIADPYGVLKPGEVHLSLTRPLVHETSQRRFDMFAGQDVLIARDPALRGSDMQKVHCVCHPRLAHLKDIIVMPSRGQIPLAAKLQGGDYDGDTIWVCADERLVKPFRNAPVLGQATIEELRIEQRKRLLRELVDEKDIGTDLHADAWLKEAFAFTSRESQLGTVTNYYYKLIYYYNDLWHPHVILVADLHDAIIDADKNGYLFDRSDWIRFRRDNKLPDLSSLKVKYSENLKALDANTEVGMLTSKVTLRDVVREGSAKEGSHVLDDLLFNVVNPKYSEILDWLHENVTMPTKEIQRDSDLEFPLQELRAQAAEAAAAGEDFPIDVDKEVKALKTNLEHVARLFARVWQGYRSREPTSDLSVPGLPECIEAYKAIQPMQDCFLWRARTAKTAPTRWECFKVAVLASPQLFQWRKGLLFWAAVDVIRYLKSHSETGMQVIEQAQAVLKPKRPKKSRNLPIRAAKPGLMVDEDDSGETTDDDDNYDDDPAGLDRALLESFGS